MSYQPVKSLLFLGKACVFVSLRNRETGDLRGCIGTIEPTEENIAKEIIHCAVSAAFSDPRFSPLTIKEFKTLDVKVDILSKFEEINSLSELDPKKYGALIKTNDGRSGLLLPDIEGINDVDSQILVCCQKGGIDPKNDKYKIFRFQVKRYQDD